jgi:PAS domain S-box-containing protein
MMRNLLRTAWMAALWMGMAFVARAEPVAVPERKDQTWKLLNLADVAGLARANLFNIAFETGGGATRRGTAWIATSDGLREFDGYTWRRHGRAEGLPSDFVRAVLVTRGGDLWVGTDRGAGIYDGRTFRTMGTETNLAGPNVRRIIEDPAGAIWFCCDSWPNAGAAGGLTRFQDGRWRSWRMSDGLPSGYVVNFLRDSKGNDFAATLGGVARREGERWIPVLEPPKDAVISFGSGCLAETPDTGLVFSSGNALHFRTDNGWKAAPPGMSHRYGLCTTRDGRLLASGISPSGHGMVVEWLSGSWEPVSAAYPLPGGYSEDIREAPDGSVWVVGFGCLVRWARESSEFREFPGPPAPRVADDEGGIWFSRQKNADNARPGSLRHQGERWDSRAATINGMLHDPAKRVVWGWDDSSVHRFEGTRERTFGPRDTGLARIVAGAVDPLGRLWLSGRTDGDRIGVASFHEGIWTRLQPEELGAMETMDSLMAPEGDGVWIGGDRGPGTDGILLHVGGGTLRRRPLPAERFSQFSTKALVDRRGDMWLLGNAGLHRWTAGANTWETVTNLPANRVMGCVERGDEVWFACMDGGGGEGGLVRLRDGLWSVFPAEIQGTLRLNLDGTLTCGGFGRFWKVNPTHDAVPVMVRLPVPERVSEVVLGKDGAFWMGWGGSVGRYRSASVPPETRITGPARVLRGEPFAATATGLERWLPGQVGEDHRFSWRLDDGPWTEASTAREFRFATSGLSRGTHRLEVRCQDGIGEFDASPASLEFVVGLRPIQERTWFLPATTVLVLVVSALAASAIKARRDLAELVSTLGRRVSERTADLELELQRRAQVERELRFHEAILRETGELAHVGGWSLDVSTGAGHWTAEVARIHGAAPGEDASRERVLGFYSGAERLRLEDALLRAARDGEPYDLELGLTTAGGTRRWVRTLGRPVREEDRIVRVFGSFQDISERKLAEEVVRERLRLQSRLATVAASVPGALFSFLVRGDGSMSFPDASPKLIEVVGLHPEDIATDAAPGFALIHPEDLPRVRARIDQVVRDHAPWYDVFRVRHPLKGVVWIEGVAHPSPAEPGFAIWHGILADVTERHNLEVRRGTEHAVVRALAETPSVDGAIPAVLRILCEAEGWNHGELWLFEESVDALVCREVWNPGTPPFQALNERTRSLRMRTGEGLIGRIHRDGEAVHIPALAEFHGFLRKPEAESAGLLSAIAFPIRTEDAVTGVLAFMGSRIEVPDSTILSMLETIGSQVGQFLSRMATEEQLRRFMALSPTTVYALREKGGRYHCHWVSENIANLTGYTRSEALTSGWWHNGLHPEDRARVLEADHRLDGQGRRILEFRFRRKDGSYLWLRDEQRLIAAGGDAPREIVGSWIDITERHALEGRLRQVQKMEAIGQLSGGIAHDFNNILGSIIGNAELGAQELPANAAGAGHFSEILRAARRATHLVQQILTFARQDSHEKRRVRLRPVVDETARLLRSTLPAGVDLHVHCEPNTPSVLADETQVQQVLLNLGTNAWHAFHGRGGRIRIELGSVRIDEAAARGNPDLQPVDYARIRVRDNGSGMDAATLERIFEPFFTTKPPGQGTGLGLSVVHGIVKSHGGAVLVDSTPGVGTTFDILLPAVTEAVATADSDAPAKPSEPAMPRGSSQHILLVDDEEILLRITTRVLERLGYRVTACGGPAIGRDRFVADPASFDLVVSDLNMPGMSGVELARELLARRSGLPVLLTSGLISEELRNEALRVGVREILRKPASVEDLAQAVHRCLLPSGTA